MSYVDQDILKSFAGDNSFATEGTAPAGLSEAILQADQIVFQKTGIAVPASPASGNAKLRWIACAIIYWTISGIQSKLTEEEIGRRKKLFDDAMTMLDRIQDGSDPIIDSSGAVLSSVPETYFSSTQRLTEPL